MSFSTSTATIPALAFIITCIAISSSSSICILSLPVAVAVAAEAAEEPLITATPTPTPWPEQFKAVTYVNYSGELQIIDLWYDWPNGRTLNLIQNQLGLLIHDVVWKNGSSFFYTWNSSVEPVCVSANFGVGILRPNWMQGGTYLGQRRIDGFLCYVWSKVDFIVYYEDVLTRRPVYWLLLFSGKTAHFMTFEVGAVLEDAEWQAPASCFKKKTDPEAEDKAVHGIGFQESLMGELLRSSVQF